MYHSQPDLLYRTGRILYCYRQRGTTPIYLDRIQRSPRSVRWTRRRRKCFAALGTHVGCRALCVRSPLGDRDPNIPTDTTPGGTTTPYRPIHGGPTVTGGKKLPGFLRCEIVINELGGPREDSGCDPGRWHCPGAREMLDVCF